MRSALGDNDMMGYLTMMAVRLIELHRVLKPTGSLYLHCDPTASHYLKILLDGIFGVFSFRTEISWKRQSAHSDAKQGRQQYGNIRDIIFFYSKTDNWKWNWLYTPYDDKYISDFYKHIESGSNRRYRLSDITGPGGAAKGNPSYEVMGVTRYWRYSKARMDDLIAKGRIIQTRPGAVPSEKRYLDEMPGVPLQNDWSDIRPTAGNESLGYPTQKPVALLERIIGASSNEGDVVLDPFCGCGTAVHAAQKLKRKWIGIDITHLAIGLIERRLKDAFPGISFEVHGTPKDLDGALDLALRDKYQFQWWAVSLIDAQPYGGKKKGADSGIDGLIYFRSDAKTTERAIVSVKGGGNVGVTMIRDLKGVLEREKAPIGIFMTLTEPTQPMIKEAASAGFYQLGNKKYPKVQIITIEKALQGAKPAIPLVDSGAAFKKANLENSSEQGRLL
jgi:DNA modification methylase